MARATMIAVAAIALAACGAVAPVAAQPHPQFREALMSIWTDTHGDGWIRSDNWATNADICTWYGVSCPLHTIDIVTDIVLKNNNLTGTLNGPEIAKISTLKNLDLSGNSIGGSLPTNLGEIVPLQTVNLFDNQFTGTLPDDICNVATNWPSMKEINLQNNMIEGTVPETFFGPAKLPVFHPRFNLQIMRLDNNKLTGTIPTRATRAGLMTTFMVNENHMSGPIDSSLDDWLMQLKYCSLGQTDTFWSCPVPQNVTDKCQAYCK